jgi:hypothetical protein
MFGTTRRSLKSTISNKRLFGRIKSIVSQLRGKKRRRNIIALKKKLFRPRPKQRFLNFGGRNWYYPRWENIDFYADPLFVDYKIDLRKKIPIPLPDNCAQLIFASHLLEHLSDEDCKFVLAEGFRLLHSNGIIRISVPDMDKAFKAYKEVDDLFFSDGGITVSGENIESKLVNFFASYEMNGYSGGPHVSKDEVQFMFNSLDKYDFVSWCISQIPENAPYKAHINGYDYDKIRRFLFSTGFSNVIKSDYRKSTVPVFREKPFDNRQKVSLFVEATK